MSGDTGDASDIFNAQGAYVKEFKVTGPFPPNSDTAVQRIRISPRRLRGRTGFPRVVRFQGCAGGRRRGLQEKPADTQAGLNVFRRFQSHFQRREEAVIRFYSADKAALWLGGSKLELAKKDSKTDEFLVDADLKSGESKVLIMLYSRKFPRFSVRISGAGGKKIEGLKYGL